MKLTEQQIKEVAHSKGMLPLAEGGVNRILAHGKDGMIIISANRSGIESYVEGNDLSAEYKQWLSLNKESDNEENRNRFLSIRNKEAEQNLKRDLQNSPFAYSPVYGGYHGSDGVDDSFEPSFIVYCHGKRYSTDKEPFEKLYNFAIELCRKYKQDSVYVQAPNEAPVWIGQNGEKLSGISSNNFKINDFSQQYYTTINRSKRNTTDMGLETKPQRFTADISFSECMWRKFGPSTYFDRMKRSQLGEVFLD